MEVRSQTIYYINCQKSDWRRMQNLTSDRKMKFFGLTSDFSYNGKDNIIIV